MPFGVWWTGWGTCLSSSFWKCIFTSGWLFDIVPGHIKYNSRWWQLNPWGNDAIWLIFFRWMGWNHQLEFNVVIPCYTQVSPFIDIHPQCQTMDDVPNVPWRVFFGGANKKDTESLQLQVNNPWKMVVDRLPYCWLKILQHLGCRKPCNNHEVYFTQIRFNGIEPSTCLQNLSAKLGDFVGYLFISVDLLSKNPTKTR